MVKQEILQLRKSSMDYDKAQELQNILIDIYRKEYKPKHNSDTYLNLIFKYKVTEIKERHPQVVNYTDKVFVCFSCVSQHVYGYTKEHCLDQIFDFAENEKKRMEEYKLLPTLEELVNSNINILPEKTYYTKINGLDWGHTVGNTGSVILEMREIGIDEYKKKSIKELFDYYFRNEKDS